MFGNVAPLNGPAKATSTRKQCSSTEPLKCGRNLARISGKDLSRRCHMQAARRLVRQRGRVYMTCWPTHEWHGVEQRKNVESPHMKRQDVLAELVGGVWHTASQDRFVRILECGAIFPEPDIPHEQRWGTAAGSEGHPYVRSIGGVSLFDLRGFEAETYSTEYPCSSWEYFVP